MKEIDVVRGQLAGAGGLTAVLEAGWEALSLVESACWECQTRSPELFAAFVFASAAATDARMALVSAPSLSAGPVEAASHVAFSLQGDAGAVADAVASLAGVLGGRLAEAGRDVDADDPADRKACEQAAAATERIVSLLERGA